MMFFSLENSAGMRVVLSDYGARIVSIVVPDRNGVFADVVLGYDSPEQYLDSKDPYFGATIGRFANRIAAGRFTLDGKVHQLELNNGSNALHGGDRGFHSVVWKPLQHGPSKVSFSYTSANGEEGFPAALHVLVEYSLTNEGNLVIEYQAESDGRTIVNLTNHAYFNLAGAGSGSVASHLATINADFYTPLNAAMIPTGEIAPVNGTALDFRVRKEIGRDWDSDDAQIRIAGGYDHNFVLNKSGNPGLEWAAKVVEPVSGRSLEVWTTEPGMQFYTGNFLDGSDVGREGIPYTRRSAFCLETQHFPDSPNQPHFPSVMLEPGNRFTSKTVFRFATE
jgi:aldose 1-epimerase